MLGGCKLLRGRSHRGLLCGKLSPKSQSRTAHADPHVLGSPRRVSSSAAAWDKGVLSVPSKGQARRCSQPC